LVYVGLIAANAFAWFFVADVRTDWGSVVVVLISGLGLAGAISLITTRPQRWYERPEQIWQRIKQQEDGP
jgi:hypothetical protein